MSEEFNRIESLLGQAKEYVNTRIAQFKLSVAEKVAKIMATVIAGFAAALVFFLFLVFAGIAAAIVLGQWTGYMWLGFLIMAVVYLLLAIIVWTAKDRLLALPIMNAIIGRLFDEEEVEDEKIRRVQDMKQERMRLRIRQLELEKQLKISWKELKTGTKPFKEPEEKKKESEEEPSRSLWSLALDYGTAYISQKLAAKAGQATEARLKESMDNLAEKLRTSFSRKRKR